MRGIFRCSLPVLCTLLAVGSVAQADDLELTWGGRLQTDVRFRVIGKSAGKWYERQDLPTGVSRNENIFKLKVDANYGDITGTAEVDFVWVGYAQQPEGLSDLTSREKLDPVRFEPHAVFIEARDLFVEGLDLRVGYQQIFWGKGDQFNPTNTINANDLEDPLLFGEQIANLMVKLDYNVWEDWTISGVLVPLFKPATIPDSGPLASATPDRIPFINDNLRWRTHNDAALAAVFGQPVVVTNVKPNLPETSLENMQVAFRIGGMVGDHDLALSYHYGRSDTPQAVMNYAAEKKLAKPLCNPNKPGQCITGITGTEIDLAYPRMQVIGLNMAGELDLFGFVSDKVHPIGYRLEVALVLPQEVSLSVYNGDMLNGMQKAGEYDYGDAMGPDGRRPLGVKDTPFLKWVVGLDYTFSEHLYLNVQWVHGFPEEFGAGDFISEGYTTVKGWAPEGSDVLGCYLAKDGSRCAAELFRPRINDYLVIGVDTRMLSQKLLFRLFTIWHLNGVYEEKWDADVGTDGERVRTHYSMFTSRGFSAVIFPELTYNVGYGLELSVGALLMLGEDTTRFGDPSVGGSQVWSRARFTW